MWNPKLYNEKHSFVYGFGESLIELLNPKFDERILDLGCGAGQLTFKISQKARDVIGLDSSPEMIVTARKSFPKINFQIGDAADFHFEEKFDGIFSNATLHWVKNYTGAIDSMYSNLKQGGKIVLEFGGKGNVETIIKQIRTTLDTWGYSNQSTLKMWYFPSIGEYTTALEKAGFNVVFAQLYDRPTELADETTGIKDWISMFGQSFFEGIKSSEIENISSEIQAKLKSKLFMNNKWYADYKRLRIVAKK